MSENSGSVLCPWCKTYFSVRLENNCVNCGGPLPPPAGPDRGEAPAPVPRFIPKQYKNKILFQNNYLLLFGALFGFANIPFTFHINGLDIFFMGIGFFLCWKGYDKAMKKINVLKLGEVAKGIITSSRENTNLSVNGKHPYIIEYSYEINEQKRTGKMNCWDEQTLAHYEGEPVWVVYLNKDFEKNSSIWPPLA